MTAKNVSDRGVRRIIDANLNRAKEGLRVCEDVCRFIYNTPALTRRHKNVRLELTQIMGVDDIPELIRARDIARDVGRVSAPIEMDRQDARDIYLANAQRVKESLRVLEEFAKLRAPQQAEKLKKLRYTVYALEKSLVR